MPASAWSRNVPVNLSVQLLRHRVSNPYAGLTGQVAGQESCRQLTAVQQRIPVNRCIRKHTVCVATTSRTQADEPEASTGTRSLKQNISASTTSSPQPASKNSKSGAPTQSQTQSLKLLEWPAICQQVSMALDTMPTYRIACTWLSLHCIKSTQHVSLKVNYTLDHTTHHKCQFLQTTHSTSQQQSSGLL